MTVASDETDPDTWEEGNRVWEIILNPEPVTMEEVKFIRGVLRSSGREWWLVVGAPEFAHWLRINISTANQLGMMKDG
jgi:hypothetical protein